MSGFDEWWDKSKALRKAFVGENLTIARAAYKQGLLDAARIAWQFGRGIKPRKKAHIMPYPDEIAEAIRQKAEELK